MLAATLALFVISLGYGVVVPLLPQLAVGRSDVDPAMISVVYAVYAAAKIGAQLPGGVWVDRAGSRRVLLVALTAFTLSLAGFLFARGLGWFAVVRAVEGAATGLAYPAVFARVLQGADPAHHGRRIATAIGVGSSGLLVGPALGGLMARPGHDPRVAILVALGLAAAITLLCLLDRPPAAALPHSRRTLGGELTLILSFARSAAFVGLMLPIAFNKLTFTAFQGLLPLYGPAHLGLDTRGVTGLFILTGVCFAAAQPLGGWLIDRFNPRSVAVALTPPLVLALAAMSLPHRGLPFAFAYGSYIALSSLIFTATMKHAARTWGSDDTYGGMFGVLATLTDLAAIVGPVLFLNLYGVVGQLVFIAMAATGLPFAALFVGLTRAGADRSRASASP